jgi:hypothetical protein
MDTTSLLCRWDALDSMASDFKAEPVATGAVNFDCDL